jgi:hypothetical protein
MSALHPPYIEFAIQSNFSFLRGASRPEELVVSACLLDHAGMGLADRNTVAGVVRAWSQSKRIERPDTGAIVQLPYHPGCRLVFADGTPDVLAYPRDRKGWGHLCRLLTQANCRDEAEKGAPIVLASDLFEWGDCMSLAALPDLEAPPNQTLAFLRRLTERFGAAVRLAVSPSYGGNDRFRLEQAAGRWRAGFCSGLAVLRNLRGRNADMALDTYTPYELSIVGTLVRLGWRQRALELLEFFLADQRPSAWNHWAEIVWCDPRTPRFIGDMPHTWIGSEFVRSVRSMFVYEDESDKALVIAAGVPAAWIENETGITLKRLSTYYGTLNYSLRKGDLDELRLKLSGDIALPPGKIIVTSPLEEPLKGVLVNGKPIETFNAHSATVGEFPADVVLH